MATETIMVGGELFARDAASKALVVQSATDSGLAFARKQLASSGTAVIVAGAAGKTARVHGLNLSLSAAATLTITDSDDTALHTLGVFDGAADIVLDTVTDKALAYAAGAAGKGLKVAVSAGTVSGSILYSVEG